MSRTVSRIDRDTKDWVVDASDDLAARRGAVMDLEAAARALDWIQNNCCLYEGDRAGELIRLMPYQRDFVTRLFGWRVWSKDRSCWVRRFKEFSLWTSKKNGKSPFVAAIGLYLLVADGEPGQKVYMAAKNGDQARIAQRHAFQMVKASPGLSEECKVYENTLAIHHLPTNSVQMILTGDDARGQKAKEGLNGSVLVDEAHVVDRAMMGRITRAGISRKQPLFGSVSTSGDDPSSWGYERFKYGRQVASGERTTDLKFLHVEYGAPDGWDEETIGRRLVEAGRLANPGWGVTVMEEEFVDDFNRCRGSGREMARFLQYRLNRWIGSTNRWLDMAGWAKGRRKYGLKELVGRECFLGLDLARRLDMAAAVFVFPWPEEAEEAVRLWPVFWLPEATARAQDNLYPFLSWGERGFLRLTPGETLDFARVKKDIRDVVRRAKLDVRTLYYDPKYAEELTQQLAEGEFNPHTGLATEDGLGCERVEFEQTITALTGPSVEFERRVRAGHVLHPGHPVLDWQAGHVEVKTDVNQNVRPVKPDPNSGKKIDGIVSAVMGLYGVVDDAKNTPVVR